MSKPWMKFYPTDWRADPALRMCSLAARGLWAEMMCLMHEAEPYGYLLIKGQPVGDRQLAALAGVSHAQVTKLLAEMEAAGVFSRDGTTIYSRRMKRDHERAERDRVNGAGGGNPSLNRGVNPPDNRVDKAQKPESKVRNKKDSPAIKSPESNIFQIFWGKFPKRKGGNPKAPAEKLFLRAVAQGADPKIMIAAVEAGVGYDRDKIDTSYIPRATTWISERRWEEYLDGTEADAERRAANFALAESKGFRLIEGKWVKPEGKEGEAA